MRCISSSVHFAKSSRRRFPARPQTVAASPNATRIGAKRRALQGARDKSRNDRRSGSRRQQRDAHLRLNAPIEIARSFRKDSQARVPLATMATAALNAAVSPRLRSTGKAPSARKYGPNSGISNSCRLAMYDDRPRRGRAERGRIEVRDVVASDDQRSAAGDMLGARHAETPDRAEQNPAHKLRKRRTSRDGYGAATAPAISAAIRSTTAAALVPVESISTAPGAGRSGAIARVASSRSRPLASLAAVRAHRRPRRCAASSAHGARRVRSGLPSRKS